MKHKCTVRTCNKAAELIWKDKAYFCDEHYLEMCKKEKEEKDEKRKQ